MEEPIKQENNDKISKNDNTHIENNDNNNNNNSNDNNVTNIIYLNTL